MGVPDPILWPGNHPDGVGRNHVCDGAEPGLCSQRADGSRHLALLATGESGAGGGFQTGDKSRRGDPAGQDLFRNG